MSGRGILLVWALAVLAVGVPSVSRGQVYEWPGNGHFYELVLTPRTWDAARIDAESRTYRGIQGHLLTATSQPETDFIAVTFGEPLRQAYIGAFNSQGRWNWITGEPFQWTNWAPGEPNGDGSVVNFHSQPNALGTWNDIPGHLQLKYFVEYSPPVVAVLPERFAVVRGVILAGGLSEMFETDDQYLFLRPGVVLSSVEAPVRVVLESTSPSATLTRLRLRVESAVSIPNIMQMTEVYNFAASAWQIVDTRPAPLNDGVVEFDTTINPSRYVRSGDRLIRARLSWKESGPVVSYPWTVRVDQVNWLAYQ